MVRSIDANSGRITLSHEPVAAMDWPAMTMPFPVKDRSLRRGRRTGERVTFAFQRPQQGQTPVIEALAPEAAQ